MLLSIVAALLAPVSVHGRVDDCRQHGQSTICRFYNDDLVINYEGVHDKQKQINLKMSIANDGSLMDCKLTESKHHPRDNDLEFWVGRCDGKIQAHLSLGDDRDYVRLFGTLKNGDIVCNLKQNDKDQDMIVCHPNMKSRNKDQVQSDAESDENHDEDVSSSSEEADIHSSENPEIDEEPSSSSSSSASEDETSPDEDGETSSNGDEEEESDSEEQSTRYLRRL